MIPEIKHTYQKRPVRFIELHACEGWTLKIYSISIKNEIIDYSLLALAKIELPLWLKKNAIYDLDTYKVATLILHEGKEGCFAILNWWIDENMLQQYVYLKSNINPNEFRFFSHNGIYTCVWEMAVLWFERNAWVEYVLKNPQNPDAIKNYLAAQLNEDV